MSEGDPQPDVSATRVAGPSDAAAVVVVGSVNADLTVRVDRHPAPGETLLGSGGTTTPGGKGANQALAAARLGARTALVGAVGDDGNARTALALLREAGVDLDAVDTVPGPTGLAVITVAETGENTIVVVPGANAAVTVEGVDEHARAVEDAQVCIVQGELPPAATVHAVRLAAGSGARVVLNLAPVHALPGDVLAAADPLVVNEHEARLALRMLADGGAPADEGRPTDDEAPGTDGHDLAGALHRAGARSVVVTLGSDGALVLDGSASPPEPVRVAAPRVHARDTTGAGDAFVGALAARLVAGASLAEAAEYAVRVGAYAVQGAGAQPSFPTGEDPLP